jgi:hypothetical protein
MEGLPALDLWSVILDRPATLFFHEDNQAMIQVCMSGRNPTMRHLGRTHRVSVNALHEMIHRDDVLLIYEESSRQAADIYTKAFTNPDKWKYACELISIFASEVQASIACDLEGTKKVPPS